MKSILDALAHSMRSDAIALRTAATALDQAAAQICPPLVSKDIEITVKGPVEDLKRSMKRAGRAILKQIADGSLEHLVLMLAKEPATLADFIAKAGAREPDVRKTVNALVAAKRLIRTGWSRSTRYQAVAR